MRRAFFTALLFSIVTASAAFAQTELAQPQQSEESQSQRSRRGDILSDAPDAWTQLAQLRHAAVRLPIAAVLACVLAFRPRRRGTPRRQSAVIQTQIILAIV